MKDAPPEERGSLTERIFYPRTPSSWAQSFLLSPLACASWAFAAGAWGRGQLYDAGILPAHRVEGLRVISVGNLNVGGSGKTPAVLFLAERLLAAGKRVALLSRGHGRKTREVMLLRAGEPLPSVNQLGDEPLLMAKRCPQAHVLVGPDRHRLALLARDELAADVVLLDDGFQHRRLARDEDIVVMDQAVGLGNGHLLPRGPLRETPAALRRATLLWLKGAPAGTQPAPLPSFGGPVVRTDYLPVDYGAPCGGRQSLASLAGKEVLALAGLARPRGFLSTLERVGVKTRETAFFADHHSFTSAELQEVERRAAGQGLLILTTEKDAMRLPPAFPAWSLRLGVQILEGAPALDQALGLAPGLPHR